MSTSAVHVSVWPLLAWKVPVKVVLASTVVVAEPEALVVEPMPLSMNTLSIEEPPQVSVVTPPPTPSKVGLAASEHVGPLPPPPPTVMGAEHVAVPPGPVTVPVNVVPEVIAGLEVAPLATGVTEPTPPLIEKLVAFVVVQES
jgi:hypothetical protein